MMLYPAVDLKDGKCVRLMQGRFDRMTEYGDDPVAMARKWASLGAEALHVVDLDGARSGTAGNREIIKAMAAAVRIPVQTGGGIRTAADVEELLAAGLARVILGTAAVKDRKMVKTMLETYGNRIIIGIDAKDGLVAVEGWESGSGLEAVAFAREMAALGAKTVIYTDIATDGTLAGPNLAAMKEMIDASGLEVIASGGVGSVTDLVALKEIGATGAITGKAIYTGAIDLAEALAVLKKGASC
jgi:phosphoribosylformimino-5-aminoimidazole carboxamide ribotide isomerase